MAKLRPRARIIRTIGDQLISGPGAAIIELVKNSYDANASFCKVAFIKNSDGKLCIWVEDDGHGMTREEIIEKWLEPATNTKEHEKYSRGGRRRVLGEKGIGRFAVSRLGSVSILTSIAENQDRELEKTTVYVDWNVFSGDSYLDDIDIEIESDVLRESGFRAGVSIEIEELRDSWTEKSLSRLVQELRRLAIPRDEDEFNIFLDIGVFTEESNGFDGQSVLEVENMDVYNPDSDEDLTRIRPFEVSGVADYKLVGDFNEDGDFDGYFQIQRGDAVKQHLKIEAPRLSADEEPCGPFSININIYDRETDAIKELFERMGLNFERIGVRRARKILTDNSGISISRNGFRIRPYGDPESDWLELEKRRVQNPSKHIGQGQVSGIIKIADRMESGLVERSSREGLEHTKSFNRLKNLLSGVIRSIEEKRFDFRERAGLGRKPTSDVDKARKASNFRRTEKAIRELPEEMQEKLVKAIEKDSSQLNQILDEIDAYQKVLQSRASLGLVVSEVIHEGRRRLHPIISASSSLKDNWKYAFEDSKAGESFRRHFPSNVERIDSNSHGLSRLFKRLDPLSGRRRGRPVGFSASEAIKDCVGILEEKINENSINIDIDVDKGLRLYGYKEDFQAALLNILENAIYWLSTSKEYKNNIEILYKSIRKNLASFLVANDGPLISEDDMGRLFEAGFSLKTDGTGLGLAIAKEACRASKGDLYYDDNAPETTFVIDFPVERTRK